jgi:hypothetical protein
MSSANFATVTTNTSSVSHMLITRVDGAATWGVTIGIRRADASPYALTDPIIDFGVACFGDQ